MEQIHQLQKTLCAIYDTWDDSGDDNFCLSCRFGQETATEQEKVQAVEAILREVGADPKAVEGYVREHRLAESPGSFRIDGERSGGFGSCIMLANFLEAVEGVLAK